MSRFTIALFTVASLSAVIPAASAGDDDEYDRDDDIPLEEVSQAARATIQREVKNGQITEIDREDHDGRVYYEVEYKEGNRRYELHVAEDGKVLLRKRD